MEPEQIQADLLRKLFRLGVIDYDTLDELIDELQIRLFKRQIDERER
jgi:hypothetical protein